MSTEPHKPRRHAGAEPVHDTVAYEIRDIKAKTIYWYLFTLGVSVVLSYGVCVFVLRLTTSIAAQSDTPPPAVRQELKDYQSMPPEPRLQGVPGHGTDPQADLRDKIRHDTEANEKAAWIDQDAGIAQIPVRDAMRIIAEKGLPAASPAGAERKK
jgi:hypothetical protein